MTVWNAQWEPIEQPQSPVVAGRRRDEEDEGLWDADWMPAVAQQQPQIASISALPVRGKREEKEASIWNADWQPEGTYRPQPSAITPPKERTLAGEAVTALPAGAIGSAEMYARAGRVLGLDTTEAIEKLKKAKEPYGPTRKGFVPEAIHGGVESTVESVLGGVPGMLAGTALGGRIGGIAGYALGAGTLFSLAEYDRFMEEAEELGIPRETVKDEAIISALAEGGIEAATDLIGAKIFGLTRSRALKGAAKTGLRSLLKKFIKNTAKLGAVEVPGEMTTSAIQARERIGAGIPSPSPWEAAKQAVGPSLVQTILMGGMGAGIESTTRKSVIPEVAPEAGIDAVKKAYLNGEITIGDIEEALKTASEMGDQQSVKKLYTFYREQKQVSKPVNIMADAAEGKRVDEEILELEDLRSALPVTQEQTPPVFVRNITPPPPFEGETWIPGTGEVAGPYPGREGLPAPALQIPERALTPEPRREAIPMRPPTESEVYFPEGFTEMGPPREEASVGKMVDEAAKETETKPTEAQKEAGNYRKGHITLQGLDISIENPKGSIREGVSPKGKKWRSRLNAHYGYILGTKGKDKDHVDVFIGPKPEEENVFVVNQVDPKTKRFDEHKILMGYPTEKRARRGYLANYEKGWKGLGSIHQLSMDQFKAWLKEGDTTKEFKPGKEPISPPAGEQIAPAPVQKEEPEGVGVPEEKIVQPGGAEGIRPTAKQPWEQTAEEFAENPLQNTFVHVGVDVDTLKPKGAKGIIWLSEGAIARVPVKGEATYLIDKSKLDPEKIVGPEVTGNRFFGYKGEIPKDAYVKLQSKEGKERWTHADIVRAAEQPEGGEKAEPEAPEPSIPPTESINKTLPGNGVRYDGPFKMEDKVVGHSFTLTEGPAEGFSLTTKTLETEEVKGAVERKLEEVGETVPEMEKKVAKEAYPLEKIPGRGKKEAMTEKGEGRIPATPKEAESGTWRDTTKWDVPKFQDIQKGKSEFFPEPAKYSKEDQSDDFRRVRLNEYTPPSLGKFLTNENIDEISNIIQAVKEGKIEGWEVKELLSKNLPLPGINEFMDMGDFPAQTVKDNISSYLSEYLRNAPDTLRTKEGTLAKHKASADIGAKALNDNPHLYDYIIKEFRRNPTLVMRNILKDIGYTKEVEEIQYQLAKAGEEQITAFEFKKSPEGKRAEFRLIKSPKPSRPPPAGETPKAEGGIELKGHVGPGEIRRFYSQNKANLDETIDVVIESARSEFPDVSDIDLREGIVSDAIAELQDKKQPLTLDAIKNEITRLFPSPPRPPSEGGQYSLARQRLSRITPIDIKKAFKGAKVVTTPTDGVYITRLPNGRFITVDTTKDAISFNPEKAAKDYGISLEKLLTEEELRAVGKYKRTGETGLIELLRTSDPGQLSHEKFHALFDLALTEDQRRRIINKYGTEEKAAEAFRRREGFTRNLWEKIKRWLDRVRSALFGDVLKPAMEATERAQEIEPGKEVERYQLVRQKNLSRTAKRVGAKPSLFQKGRIEAEAALQSIKEAKIPKGGFLNNLLSTIEWTDHPVERLIYEATQNREMHKHRYFYDIDHDKETDKGTSEVLRDIKFKGMGFLRRVMGSDLYDSDNPRISERYRRIWKIIDYCDVKKVKWFDEAEGREGLREKMVKRGVSKEIIESVDTYRRSMDKALGFMRLRLKEVIDAYKAAGKEIPVLTHLPDEKGKAKPYTLIDAYNEMGTHEGYYAPRIREHGEWAVLSISPDGQAYRYHAASNRKAIKLMKRLRAEGHTDLKKLSPGDPGNERLPEDLYEELRVGDVGKALEHAVGGLKGVDPDVQAQLRMDVIQAAADMLKARAFRAHRIARRKDQVVRGYIEDPLARHLLYSHRIAGGIAKGEAAVDMLTALNGEFREYRREEDFWVLEKDGAVIDVKPLSEKDKKSDKDKKSLKFGGIDPGREPLVYTKMKRYIREQLRNPDRYDRMIGIGKSIVSMKFLGFNPRAATVNTTAMITTAPPAIHQWVLGGKGSLTAINAALARAGKDYIGVMRGKALKNRGEQAFLDRIREDGYDRPQYMMEAMGSVRDMYGKGWANAMKGAMYLFSKTEQWNRGSTMLAGYRLARQHGQDHETAMQNAREASNRAHGVYGKATLPAWAQGTNPFAKIGQMTYVYQKFSHNYVQMLYDLGYKKRNIKALAFAIASPAVIGGLKSSILASGILMVAKGIMRAIGDDRDPEKLVYDTIREELGEKTEEVVRFGAFGAAGVDLSGSLSIGMEVPRSLIDLTGPFGGVYQDITQAAHYMETGQSLRAVEMALPNVMSSVMRAIRELEGVTKRTGKRLWTEEGEPYVPSIRETITRAAGYRPTKRAAIESRIWESKREAAVWARKRNRIYEKFRGYMLSRDESLLEEIHEEIAKYNEKVIRSGRQNMVPLITRQSLRRQISGMMRPGKKEMGYLSN